MDAALFALVALACPLGMVLMMVFMGRGMMGRGNRNGQSGAAQGEHRAEDVDALREEKERLDEQIGALEAQQAARR